MSERFRLPQHPQSDTLSTYTFSRRNLSFVWEMVRMSLIVWEKKMVLFSFLGPRKLLRSILFPQLFFSRLFPPHPPTCDETLTLSSWETAGPGSDRMLSPPPSTSLVQSPEELLKAEAAGASGIRYSRASRSPDPREKGQGCSFK